MFRTLSLLALVALAGLPGCNPCLTDATAQVSPEALFHTGRTDLMVMFDKWEHGFEVGPVEDDAAVVTVDPADGATAKDVVITGPRSLTLAVELPTTPTVETVQLRFRSAQSNDATCSAGEVQLLVAATATRLPPAPSGDGFCCPTGGDCNGYSIGGWVPTDSTRCQIAADGRDPTFSKDEHGCSVAHFMGSCL